MGASILKSFFGEYFPNYVINKIPFYGIRHGYYRLVLKHKIGRGTSIHLNCYLLGKHIDIGENSVINRNCFLDGRGKLTIGKNVSISPGVQLITGEHEMNAPSFEFVSKDLCIEDYVWIGTNVIVLPGIRIGRGAVVCSGAIVTKDVGPLQVVAGIPARVIKYREEAALKYTLKWNPWFD